MQSPYFHLMARFLWKPLCLLSKYKMQMFLYFFFNSWWRLMLCFRTHYPHLYVCALVISAASIERWLVICPGTTQLLCCFTLMQWSRNTKLCHWQDSLFLIGCSETGNHLSQEVRRDTSCTKDHTESTISSIQSGSFQTMEGGKKTPSKIYNII